MTVAADIRLAPVELPITPRSRGTRDGQTLYRLAFTMQAPWMRDAIELRYPEVVESALGYHFIDHYRTTLAPLSEPEPFPCWQWEAATGRLGYRHRTREGLAWRAAAQAGRDEVALEFTVENLTGGTLAFVDVNPCLIHQDSRDFRRCDLEAVFIVYEGRLRDLRAVTPSPAQVGREPWFVFQLGRAASAADGPWDTGTMWWRANQVAEENLMALATADGAHLVGYTWDAWPDVLMTNCKHPCQHTGPGRVRDLAAGGRHTWRGKIYFLDNDSDELLRRYRADRQRWDRAAAKENTP